MICPMCGMSDHSSLKDCPLWVIREPEVIARAQAGDGDAFGQLYERYRQRVMNIVQKTVPFDEVDDMTQEVFLQAFIGLPRYRGEAKFYSWLHGIALQAGYHYHRKCVATTPDPMDPDDVESAIQERAAGPLAELEADRELERVDAALRQLPDCYRETLLLRDLELMSERQISDAMGIPLATVKSRLVRARKALGLKSGRQAFA